MHLSTGLLYLFLVWLVLPVWLHEKVNKTNRQSDIGFDDDDGGGGMFQNWISEFYAKCVYVWSNEKFYVQKRERDDVTLLTKVTRW